MMKNVNIAQIIQKVKNSDFCLNCEMPLGYVDGYPVLSIRNSRLYLEIPFLKYKITGEVDKTLVYPIRYLITVSLQNGTVVGFEDLSADPMFRKIDFNKAVGFFRHEAVKKYNKQEYKEKRECLYEMYNKVAMSVMYNTPYTEEEDSQFKELLNVMLEPSLKPIYRFIDVDFYEKYLG